MESQSRCKDSETEARLLSVAEILPNPYQPRQAFPEEELRQLADSMAAQGVIQPIVVTAAPEGYRLVVGERRLRAAKLLGLESIPAIVRQLDEGALLELALVENLQRQDLNPIEEAQALSFLNREFNLSQEALAQRLGKSRPYVSNSLRLLGLPQSIKDDVAKGVLRAGHARAVLALEGEEERLRAWEYIKREFLSVRQTEEYVRALQQSEPEPSPLPPPAPASQRPTHSPERKDLLDRLRFSFGADIRLNARPDGHGKLEFHYKNQEELERIVECLMYLTKS